MDEFIEAAKGALDPEKEINEALGYTELSESLLREYHLVSQRLKGLEALQKSLRRQILDFSKDQRGAMAIGKMTLFLKPRKGAISVDWERYIIDEYGEPAWKDLQHILDLAKQGKAPFLHSWIKVAKDSVNVETAEEASATKEPEEIPEV